MTKCKFSFFSAILVDLFTTIILSIIGNRGYVDMYFLCNVLITIKLYSSELGTQHPVYFQCILLWPVSGLQCKYIIYDVIG